MNNECPIQGLAEIALRVADLDTMQQFYAEVIGLTLMRRFENSAFFRIAEGVGGHTQILALFDRSSVAGSQPPEIESSTVDHLAFGINVEDFESEVTRLRATGRKVTTTEHAWVQWRSMYVRDPEGNLVELVCFDASIPAET